MAVRNPVDASGQIGDDGAKGGVRMNICKVCNEYTTESDDKLICLKCQDRGFRLNDHEIFTITGIRIVGFHNLTPFIVDKGAKFPERIVLIQNHD